MGGKERQKSLAKKVGRYSLEKCLFCLKWERIYDVKNRFTFLISTHSYLLSKLPMSKCANSDILICDEMKISCTRLFFTLNRSSCGFKGLITKSSVVLRTMAAKNAVFSSDLFRQKMTKLHIFGKLHTHTYREAIRIQGHHWACTCKIKSSKGEGSKKSKVDIFGHFLVSEKVSRPLFIQFRERKKVLPDSSSAAQFTTYYLNDPKKNANFFPVTILMAVIYNRKIA